ncbi:hypothetical protein QBC38DRAFT_486367 [Podospora fimiseda]|uniref:Uncharacterized protein n=1 Tax=Podospora fimiseda TaxID=252190 RepID=A0AAN7BIR0_9PEZI|nr:hypothetical protein QBC38DRAFT_486367 [Podospora fimiseda]
MWRSRYQTIEIRPVFFLLQSTTGQLAYLVTIFVLFWSQKDAHKVHLRCGVQGSDLAGWHLVMLVTQSCVFMMLTS